MRFNYQRAREICGLSRKDAAKSLGMSAKTLGSYESGKTSPSADSLIAMCRLYGCTADSLLGFSDLRGTGSNGNQLMQLSTDEARIIEQYRSCTPQWRENVAMTAEASAKESKRHPNIVYLPPRNER